jgi:hypothetical protein
MIANRTRTPRKGVASLELVLAFPIMLFCVAGVMYAGRAGLARTSVAISVRRTVFLEREKAKSPSPLSVFESVDNTNKVATGRSFKAWVRGPKQPMASSESTILTGEWNHHSVRFDPNRGMITPHLSVLAKFVGSTGLGSGAEKVMGGLGKALEFVLTNKLVITAGKVANGVLDVGAVWLKYTLLPVLQLAEYAVKIANLNPFVSLGALDDAIDTFQTAVQSLIDATDEKPGKWSLGELFDLAMYFN